jgi:hypothetical protein
VRLKEPSVGPFLIDDVCRAASNSLNKGDQSECGTHPPLIADAISDHRVQPRSVQSRFCLASLNFRAASYAGHSSSSRSRLEEAVTGLQKKWPTSTFERDKNLGVNLNHGMIFIHDEASRIGSGERGLTVRPK